MKNFFKEFKEFISRGNVLDMAVGIIIGGAFTSIVTSLVNDILSPIINTILGGFSFDSMSVQVKLPWITSIIESEKAAGVAEADLTKYPCFNFGSFLNAIIVFLVTAFALFLIIKGINSLKKLTTKKKEEAPAAPTTRVCPFCKSEVDIEATKCKFCTSDLPELEYQPEEAAIEEKPAE